MPRRRRREQIYIAHHHNPTGTPHAHAIAGTMRPRRYVEGTWRRWDDNGDAWEQVPGSERLVWRRMGRP